jgi:adenylylsulfate kinase
LQVSRLFLEAGTLVSTCFISPFKADREGARAIVNRGCDDGTGEGVNFLEIYVNPSLESCEARDPKGLYKKARAGVIPHFTGVSSPYEPPDQPDLEVRTDEVSVEEGVGMVLELLRARGVIPA